MLATALQQNLAGVKPAYTIQSVFDGSSPQTIDGQSISNDPTDPKSGNYTLADAMTLSLNTVFYQLASDVKPTNVATLAHSMGIAPTTGDGTPTLAINGVTDDRIGIGGYEVRPIDQAVGYATLANGGTVNNSYFVQKVTDAAGNVLYQHKSAGKRVIDPKIANDTTLSMEKVASSSGLALDRWTGGGGQDRHGRHREHRRTPPTPGRSGSPRGERGVVGRLEHPRSDLRQRRHVDVRARESGQGLAAVHERLPRHDAEAGAADQAADRRRRRRPRRRRRADPDHVDPDAQSDADADHVGADDAAADHADADPTDDAQPPSYRR